MMQHRYYIGRGPQADMLIAHCEAMRAERGLIIRQVNDDYAPGKVVITSDGIAIGYEAAVDHAHRRWLRSLGAIEYQSGKLYLYEPRPVGEKGKRLGELLSQPCMHFDASDYIVDACGMRVYDGGGSLSVEQSEAAYINGLVFVTVPMDDGLMPPAPSAWLENVSEDEFVKRWREAVD